MVPETEEATREEIKKKMYPLEMKNQIGVKKAWHSMVYFNAVIGQQWLSKLPLSALRC